MDLLTNVLLILLVGIIYWLFNRECYSEEIEEITEPGKTIAEAHVYIAYGRNDEAREILNEALEFYPDDHELKKLLDSI